MKPLSLIEILEPRIAPAVVFNISADGRSGTYLDADGDIVTLKITRGNLNHAVVTFNEMGSPVAGGGTLDLLDISAAEFAGTNVTLTAKASDTGNGFANVGQLTAAGRSLGSVIIDGDLRSISCGEDTGLTPALKLLKAQSMGFSGVPSTAYAPSIKGDLGSLVIKDGIHYVHIQVQVTGGEADIGRIAIGGSMVAGHIYADGDIGKATIGGGLFANVFAAGLRADGDIGAVSVGGSLIGAWISANGDVDRVKIRGDIRPGVFGYGGQVTAGGKIGFVSIAGSLIGGSGSESGLIRGQLGIGSAQVGGDLVGSDGSHSGSVEAGLLNAVTDAVLQTGALGKLKVGGSVIGGSLKFSGGILSVGPLGTVAVAGDLVGGSEANTGDISSMDNIGRISIGGSVLGGTHAYSGRLTAASGSIQTVSIHGDLHGGKEANTGIIFTMNAIGKVTIGGSVVAGTGALSGSIRAGSVLGGVSIGEDIVGTETHPVYITATGTTTATNTASAVAIKTLVVGGGVRFASILAGCEPIVLTPMIGDAGIGSIQVGQDSYGLRIAAGTFRGADSLYGTNDDTFIDGGAADIASTIGRIVIKGQVLGTHLSYSETDSFCFMAEKIGKVKIGSTTIPVESGPPIPISTTNDVWIRVA